MAFSQRLKEVLGEPDGILADVSGGKAAIRIGMTGEDMAASTIIAMKKGLWGRESSVRQVGLAYAVELLDRFGDEIEAVFTLRSRDTAAEWLVSIATGVATPYPILENGKRLTAEDDEIIETDLPGIRILASRGESDPSDVDALRRVLAASSYYRKRRQGREDD